MSCKDVKRKPVDKNLSVDVLNTLLKEFDVLPLVERKVYNLTHRNHYSLRTNALLACKWKQLVRQQSVESEWTKTSFHFPSNRDFHFVNQQLRFDPELSWNQNHEFRRRMMPGPGIDDYGQTPIPNDMHLRKTTKMAAGSQEQSRKRIKQT